MAHRVSGRMCYFHPSTNNYRLLVSPATVERIEDLGSLQELVDGQSWMDHAAGLMPDSAWHVVCVTNVEYYVYHNMAALIQGPTDLSDDDESDGDDVAGPDGDEDANPVRHVRGLAVPDLVDWIRAVHGYSSLCVFKCITWLDGHRTSNALMRGGFYYYHQWWISREGFLDMEEFPGLTMDDLELVETMFSTGVFMGIHAGWQWVQLWMSATALSPSPGHGSCHKCTSGGGPALPPHWGPQNLC